MRKSRPSLEHHIGAPSDTEAPRKKAPERHIPREDSLDLSALILDNVNEKKLRADESNRTEGTEPDSWNQSTGSSLLNHGAGFLSSSSPLGGASLSSSVPLSASNDSKMTAASSVQQPMSQPKEQPKEMNKKRAAAAAAVQFNPSVRIRPVPSLSFMSDEERSAIWYCGAELENFQEGIRKDVKHMRKFPGLPPGHMVDTAERCCRGIEHFVSRDTLDARETPKHTLLSSILQVQTKVRSAAASVDVPVGDDEAAHKMQRAINRTIGSVSTKLSLEARSRAAMLGASDRAFVAAEEAGLRAWLASYSLASPTAPTDVHSGSNFAAAATTNNTSASSVQPTPAGPSLKRSASSSPNMMMPRTTTSVSSSSADSSAVLHAYQQFATHRRRRISNLREELLQRMTISDTAEPTAPPR